MSNKLEKLMLGIAVAVMLLAAVLLIGFSNELGPTGAMIVTLGNKQELNLPLFFGIGLLILGLILFIKKK